MTADLKTRRQQFWEAVYNTFDPLEPVTDPVLRVRRSGHYSPGEKIVTSLLLPFGRRQLLVAGGIGSGKSTELMMIGEQLTHARTVIMFDLWRHMERAVKDPSAIETLQAWELIGLIGLAVLRVGTELGHDWKGTDTALKNALSVQSPGATIDVAKLASGIAVFVGGAVTATATGDGGAIGAGVASKALAGLKATAGAFSWKIGRRTTPQPHDQDDAVRSVLQATCDVIESLQTHRSTKIVLIVDGLDRVRRHSTFEALFVGSDLLRMLPCDIVVSAHLALVQRFRGSIRLDRHDLANLPVASRSNPWKHGDGTVFFRKLVDKRLEAIAKTHEVPPNVLNDELCSELAWCSGGRLRDFMGFIRNLAEQAYTPGLDAITEQQTEPVLDKARRDKSDGLNRSEIETLQSVVDDPKRRLPGGEVAMNLLERQLLLSYPNADTWYLPHPLLMRTLIQPGSNESS